MAASKITPTEEKVLLWSHSDGNIGATTLISGVDLTQYSEFEVWIQGFPSDRAATPFRFPRNASNKLCCLVDGEFLVYRSFTATDTAVTCTTGHRITSYGSGAAVQEAWRACPLKLYGIR